MKDGDPNLEKFTYTRVQVWIWRSFVFLYK